MSVHRLSTLTGMSMLVHDETPYVRRVLRSTLNGEGLRSIDVSEDFSTLSNRIWALRPDIIVMSWEPKQADRIELVRMIRGGHRGMDPDTRIVAATSCAQLEFIKGLSKIGANGVILKPFNAKTVLTQVQRMGEQRIAQRQQRMQDIAESTYDHTFGAERFSAR
jgi:two-component system, chemotaxis family, chemotaxis protein CheY